MPVNRSSGSPLVHEQALMNQSDPEVYKFVVSKKKRLKGGVEMFANENFTGLPVLHKPRSGPGL